MHCDVHFLRVISFTKDFIDIMYILVPILLIVLVSVDLGKIVIGKADDISKVLKTITKRVIAALVIFFVPLLVTLSMDLISYNDPNGALACWEYATDEIIEVKMKEADAKAKAEKEKREKEYEEEKKRKLQEKKDKLAEKLKESDAKAAEEEAKKNNDSAVNIPKSTSTKPFVNGVQRWLKDGDCMKQSDKCFCPAAGNLSGFYFTMESATSRNMNWTKRSTAEDIVFIKVNCGNGLILKGQVNEKVKDNFEEAFNSICTLTTTGKGGIKIDTSQIKNSGIFVERTTSRTKEGYRKICSNHSYGAAIDLNDKLSITVNGKEYKPYDGMGKSTKSEYDRFVKAIGREFESRNVNYILWKYAFEPAGFSWGGNWSDNSFDPMHFEIFN